VALDVRIGGGPSTIRQLLAAGLIGHMHVVILPIVLAPADPSRDEWHGASLRRLSPA
jgi:dihydrofolate reductase